MPVIVVKTVAGLTDEEKGRLVETMTEAVRTVPGKNPETTHVIIDEIPAENWGLRGKTVANIRAGK